jgi:hypothetical protein
MSITGLYLYDYRYNLQLDINKLVADISKDIFIDKLCEPTLNKHDLKEASHVIGHFSSNALLENGDEENQFEYLYSNEKLSIESNFQIVLCITTQKPGFPLTSNYEPRRIESKGCVRYIFYVNETDNLTKDEVIKAFYKMDQHEAQLLYERKYDRVSPYIISLFKLVFEVLSALSILCQAFLITDFSIQVKESKNHVFLTTFEKQHPVVQEALRLIKWSERLDSTKFSVELSYY